MRPIIVEGVDGTGKTTLAKHITEILGDELHKKTIYLHNGGPLHTDMDVWIRHRSIVKQNSNLLFNGTVPVWDRVVAISDLIYGRVIRQRYSSDHLSFFAEMIKAYHNPFILWCDTNEWTIRENLRKTAEEQGKKGYKPAEHFTKVIGKITPLRDYYSSFMRYLIREHSSDCTILRVDLFTGGEKAIRKFICAAYS